MSNQNNDMVKDLSNRVQGVIESGNRRRFIIRKANGDALVNVTLTVAVVTALLAMIIFDGLFFFALFIGAIVAVTQKVSVEIVKEIDDKMKNDDKRKNDDSNVEIIA